MDSPPPNSDLLSVRCPLFGRCNGCQYQHLSYDMQLSLKGQQIAELFEEFSDGTFAISAPLASPKDYGYRTKLTPHYGRIRGNGDEPIGFRGVPDQRIIDVENCPLATESINNFLPFCRKKIRNTATKRGGTLLLRQGNERVTDDSRELLSETVGELTYHFTAGDFFQNNASILPIFSDYVVSQALGDGIDHLVDAYCGVGFFAVAAAKKISSVAGIEICRASVKLANVNAVTNGVPHAKFFSGEADNIFSTIDFPAEKTAVITDPPRSGCGASFLRQLLKFSPRRIVYVSCNPYSQVEDLRPLLPAYAIAAVQPIDLFPQTKHIENVVTLCRRNF